MRLEVEGKKRLKKKKDKKKDTAKVPSVNYPE